MQVGGVLGLKLLELNNASLVVMVFRVSKLAKIVIGIFKLGSEIMRALMVKWD